MHEANTTGILERYQRLIEISRDLASTLDLNTLLNRIVQAAADLSGAEAASILLFDEIKQQLYFDAATNLEKPLMRGLVVPVENSIAGWIVRSRQPIMITDVENDPRHFGGVAKSTNVSTSSLLGVPLIARGHVIGALEAINKRLGKFSQEDQDLLMALGAQAAAAIENARLFQQSDLISELVHEIRTPLTSLNTAAKLILHPQLSGDRRNQMVEVIICETGRLSEMTTAFLDLARLESGRAQFQPRVFDVVELIDECINLMKGKAMERDIRFRLERLGRLPPLKADRDKIKQVALNLISNAIKYNRAAGMITIRMQAKQEEMVFQIQDTGPGIPPDSLEHMFTKFYRVPGTERAVQGTGLGLAICKRIVDAHNGRIEVYSEPGVGTTFTVSLPLSKNAS